MSNLTAALHSQAIMVHSCQRVVNLGLPLQATLASIRTAQEGAAITEVSLLNFVVSDGSTLVATRYVSHEGEEAASLYYAEGSAFQVHEHRCSPPFSPGRPVQVRPCQHVTGLVELLTGTLTRRSAPSWLPAEASPFSAQHLVFCLGAGSELRITFAIVKTCGSLGLKVFIALLCSAALQKPGRLMRPPPPPCPPRVQPGGRRAQRPAAPPRMQPAPATQPLLER